jgi:putative SOS response-associated peptidase YedK
VSGVCGRFTSRTPLDDIVAAFDVDEVAAPDLGARYNVAPTDEVYAVAEVDGVRRLGSLRWGLVPWWADDPKIGSRMINARAETVATKPAFRKLLRQRRCLIPADGFYEWRKASGDRPKQAFHIRPADGGLLAFAGLWDTWRPKGGSGERERLTTCTIITTTAEEPVGVVHDRMPVVLDPESWGLWLDTDVDDDELLTSLLRPAHDLELVPVGDAVNNVRNDGPHLLQPVDN